MEPKHYLSDSNKIERIRQAVIRRKHQVTIGDIVSDTGLPALEVEQGLKSLLGSHEGTLRVSEHGELLFAFEAGFIERDHRSWWERSKEGIYKAFKASFKVLIMLVLVIYFILYLLILLFLLTQNRSSSSSSESSSGFGFDGMIWLFWGVGRHSPSVEYDGRRGKPNRPFYQRVYEFVFGPEEPAKDPLAEQGQLAQLIRARQGIVTLDDWILTSGRTRSEAESDLSRATAVFDGQAEIMPDGTLLYTFAEMMKSGKEGRSQALSAPKQAWQRLQLEKPLSGRPGESKVAIYALNGFNLLMSLFMIAGLQSVDPALLLDSQAVVQQSTEFIANHSSLLVWLGYIPLVFSVLVFLIPLLRLPANLQENKKRRQNNLRKLSIRKLATSPSSDISMTELSQDVNKALRSHSQKLALPEELNPVLDVLANDFDAELELSRQKEIHYNFDAMRRRLAVAQEAREKRKLQQQGLGRVIFSTGEDAAEAEQRAHEIEMEDFEARIQGGSAPEDYGYGDKSYGSMAAPLRSKSREH